MPTVTVDRSIVDRYLSDHRAVRDGRRRGFLSGDEADELIRRLDDALWFHVEPLEAIELELHVIREVADHPGYSAHV